MTAADKNATAEGPEIDGWATVTGDNAVQVLLYCHHDDWDVERTFDIDLMVGKMPFDGEARVTHYRVDATHSNAYAEWERQGRPNYPTAEQYAAIKARDGLETCEATRTVRLNDGCFLHRFPLPTHAVSMLIIEKA